MRNNRADGAPKRRVEPTWSQIIEDDFAIGAVLQLISGSVEGILCCLARSRHSLAHTRCLITCIAASHDEFRWSKLL